MADVKKFLEELKLKKPREIKLDELVGLEGTSVYATPKTCLILTETRHLGNICTGERFWFLPQEYRWLKEEELTGKIHPYILGIGRVEKEQAYVSHIFSLTDADKKAIADMLKVRGKTIHITQASKVELTYDYDKGVLQVVHPDKMLQYTITEGELSKVQEFFS